MSVSGDTQPEEARIFLDSEGRGVMGSGKRTLSVRTILRAWGTSREMITKPEALFKRSTCSRGLTTLDQPQHHSTPQPGTVASAHKSGEAEAGKQSVVGRSAKLLAERPLFPVIYPKWRESSESIYPTIKSVHSLEGR